jgi:lipocalin
MLNEPSYDIGDHDYCYAHSFVVLYTSVDHIFVLAKTFANSDQLCRKMLKLSIFEGWDGRYH